MYYRFPFNDFVTSCFAGLFLLLLSPALCSQVVYVKQNATGTNNGTSWVNAFTNVQPAINAATAGSQVWVAAGTYSPASATSFTMKAGVAIYGGFAGSETLLSQRNWTLNTTILQGNGNSVVKNIFTSATALPSSAVLDGFTVQKGFGGPYGGGIYNVYASPTLNNLSITTNTSLNTGGGILNQSSSPAITNVTLAANKAASYGGGMANVGANPVINGLTVINNNASWGGGLSFVSTAASFSNVLIMGNTSSYGGGVWVDAASSPTLYNAVINSNSVTVGVGKGGGVFNSSKLTLINCAISSHTAVSGGGIYNDSILVFVGGTVTANTASGAGGGCYNTSGSGTISNVTFSACSSTTGGAIYNNSSSQVFNALSIISNTASIYGGGIYNFSSSSPVINNCTVTSNKCDNFGAGISNKSSSPLITNSFINANLTFNLGGGIYNDAASSPTIVNTSVTTNTSLFNGGGMYNLSSTPQIRNSIFANNYATNFGAAICNFSCSPVFVNVAVVTNTAYKGGGFYNYVASPSLENVTVAGNNATYGGGIFNNYSYSPIANCIVYGNSAPTGSNIANGVSSPTISFCLFQGSISNSGAWNIITGANGGGNLSPNVSPFIPGAYQLAPSSAAINSGKNSLYTSAITTDLPGNPRTVGCSIDMGAYEYQNIINTPTLTITGQTIVCPGDSSLLTALHSPASNIVSWNSNLSLTTNTLYASGPGIYSVQVVSQNLSCSANAQITLNVYPTPIPTITLVGNNLSTGNFFSYQWTLNGININGATSQNYTPLAEGNYSVKVTNNGCVGVSTGFNFVFTGIEELRQNSVLLFPNPVKDKLVIAGLITEKPFQYVIWDSFGKQIITGILAGEQSRQIDLSKLAAGFYLFQISDGSISVSKKLCKE